MVIFLGFQNGIRGYLTLDLDNKEIIVSKSVKFHEIIFPYREKKNRHKAIYTSSSYKLGVVKSSCNFKIFHYNITRLQLLKDIAKRLPNAQAHKQETSNAQSQLKDNFTT